MRQIIPALLSNDKDELQHQLDTVAQLTEWVQLDIADGAFVNNTTVSVADTANLSTPTQKEVHLMVYNPTEHFRSCQNIGAKRVYVHAEVIEDAVTFLQAVSVYAFTLGIAINPGTDLAELMQYQNKVQHYMIMGVDPGWQGSAYHPETPERIQQLKKMMPTAVISVDGGINLDNIRSVVEAGAENMCVGSAIFGSEDPAATVEKMKKIIS